MRIWLLLFAAAALLTGQAPQPGKPSGYDPAGDESFRVYTEHPRLLLTSAKLRLLRRERERSSPRWQQFELLMKGRAQMPEPGFAGALFYQVSGDRAAGTRAVSWAVTTATDVRQIAMVFDWCQPLLTDADRKILAGKLRQAVSAPAKADPVSMRNRVLAAVAVADHVDSDISTPALEQSIRGWWRERTAPQWKASGQRYTRAELYAILELFHVVRDNLNIDLRDELGPVLAELPARLLLSYYPAAFPAPENDYRVPQYYGDGDPDLRSATFARALELAYVAFDTNLRASQFLQGWLMHDRFAMRGALGATYEFLWANPYLPGLSYYHMPLFVHDKNSGELYLRSSWDEDARWLGYSAGRAQVFQDGKRYALGAKTRQIDIGDATVVAGTPPMVIDRNDGDPPNVFVVGLQPSRAYAIEVDDEELAEETSDRGGILPVLSTRTDGRRLLITAPR